jgi:hypothetical protein
MPEAGEHRASVSDVFSNVRAHRIEYVSGNIGEDMLLGGASSGGSDDYRQARELAALFCQSPQAVAEHCRRAEWRRRELSASRFRKE